uniref:Uncharacterized protein n=1 Tax=Zooxanthella nutricula TaxID=1333877 RepID=A0A7S2MMN3_9DINO
MGASPLKTRPPRELEAALAHAERRRTEELLRAAALHVPDPALLRSLTVQHGLRAWLAADRESSVRTTAAGVHAWADLTGLGHDAVPVIGGQLPSRTGAINGLSAMRFAGDHALKAAQPLVCKTVALVVQHFDVSHDATGLFSEIGDRAILRLSDPVRGYWRGPQSGRALERKDWQYRQPQKIWLNGDNQAERWAGFPSAPVVVIGVRHSVRLADDADFVFRLGGGDWGFDGLLGEVLVYDRELAEHEVQEVNTYLTQKWGIGVAASARGSDGADEL